MTSGPNELKAALQRLIDGNASEADRDEVMLIDREIGDRRGEGTELWNMSLTLTNSASALKPFNTPNTHSPFSSRSKIPPPRKCARNLLPGASKQTRETYFFTDANGTRSRIDAANF